MAFRRMVATILRFCFAAAVIPFALSLTCRPALADRSPFKTYDAEQGLASLGGSCMVQDRAGYLLVCTEHGVFSYDGRRFFNLGVDQGLRAGGIAYDIALTRSGRVAISFADEVFVSDKPSDASHAPGSLTFHKAVHRGTTYFEERPHRLAAWQNGLVLVAGGITSRIVLSDDAPPLVEAIGYQPGERRMLDGAAAVFLAQGHLWESFDNGRLCQADPGAVRCYGPADGLTGGPWSDVKAGPGGTVLARGPNVVAVLDPASGRWSVTELPDQGGRYVTHNGNLGLFVTPDGSLVTQAEHGLAVLKAGQWHGLNVEDGAPSGIITSAMTDSSGQIWFQVLGRGLVRWVGYGHWEVLQRADGLSDGLPWRTARTADGSLWIATDTGVDQVVRHGAVLHVSKVLPGAAFAIAAGRNGELWRGFGKDGARVVDPATGATLRVASPSLDAVTVDREGIVWLGTEAGLFKVAARPGSALTAVPVSGRNAQVVDVISDSHTGVFYLSGGRLRHVRPDGSDVAVTGPWPGDGFEPLALALAQDGTVWVGGEGGLFGLTIADDRIVSYRNISVADTRTNSVVALLVDHRGWLWVGTALGVSVNDGKRWVSVDSDGGLLSDDVDQGGMREDPDGSLWIATSQGVSHLVDPEWLFTDRPIQTVVTAATLGTHPVESGVMPYSDEALILQFGSPSHGAERSFKFRYQLSGVDADWADSPTGLVRYPFVPPGSHTLTVVGLDELTHRTSPPATLTIEMEYPWWRQSWAELMWATLAVWLIYIGMRLRFRAMLARQAELKRYVAEGTEQLRYQAAHDALTGLLNRSEIERRLATKLTHGPVSGEMIVALLDIDNFKAVNDRYGHLGGDDVLRAMGRLVRKAVRVGEYAGRYGGEEILLVLDDSDGRGAERVLDLHHAVRGESFSAAGKELRVTCSVGMAWAMRGDDWESLIGRADQALYEAKEAGRDRVVERARVEFDAARVDFRSGE